MTTPMRTAILTLTAAATLANAGDRLVATVAVPDFDVPTSTIVTLNPAFPATTEPITGFGITARYTGVVRDNQDGLGPWSLDVRLTAIAPDSTTLIWTPIGGDITIADYPLQDATTGLPSVDGNGAWTVRFDSTDPSPVWTYGLRDVQLHLLADAPDQTETYSATPSTAQQWSRPFFIAGVSGLGPVAYDAFEFTVTESGMYELTSVLPITADHFTALYRTDGPGQFDPLQPLVNLLDYGLGNGFSPFNVPRGTSRIEALLIAGETYTWVTSQWSSGSTIQTATNTIVGPGIPADPNQCAADWNMSGGVDVFDILDYLADWQNMSPDTDLTGEGMINVFDILGFLDAWEQGCP